MDMSMMGDTGGSSNDLARKGVSMALFAVTGIPPQVFDAGLKLAQNPKENNNQDTLNAGASMAMGM